MPRVLAAFTGFWPTVPRRAARKVISVIFCFEMALKWGGRAPRAEGQMRGPAD